MEPKTVEINKISEKDLFNYPWGSWYAACGCTGLHLVYENDIPTNGLEFAELDTKSKDISNYFHEFAAIAFMKKKTHEAYDYAKYHIKYLYENDGDSDVICMFEVDCKYRIKRELDECLNNNDLYYDLCETYIKGEELQYT